MPPPPDAPEAPEHAPVAVAPAVGVPAQDVYNPTDPHEDTERLFQWCYLDGGNFEHVHWLMDNGFSFTSRDRDHGHGRYYRRAYKFCYGTPTSPLVPVADSSNIFHWYTTESGNGNPDTYSDRGWSYTTTRYVGDRNLHYYRKPIIMSGRARVDRAAAAAAAAIADATASTAANPPAAGPPANQNEAAPGASRAATAAAAVRARYARRMREEESAQARSVRGRME